MSYEALREQTLQFMIQRGWKQKLAKRGGGFEQSLLEHSINCLDVMLTMLPTLKARLKLSEEEEQALVLGISIHDVAKERDEWQAYILGTGEYTPHVIPDYTAEAVEELAAHLSFSGEGDAQAAANLHMHSVQTAARIFTEAQRGGPRVILLHEIVDAVDSISSAKGLLAARDALARSPLNDYFYCTYHIVHTRGVSTTLLHRAAQNAFEEAGWTPLLYYPTGTLYLRSGAEEPVPVTAEMVEAKLAVVLKELLAQKTETLPPLIVGNITATFLPKPEIFDCRSLRLYLEEATKRAGRRSGKRVSAKNAWKYKNFRALLAATKDSDIANQASAGSPSRLFKKVPEEYHDLLVAEPNDLSNPESQHLRNRMGEAYPEMAVFKFFREATNLMDEKGLEAARETYNNLFGKAAFNALTSTSTLMPAKDQAFTVDFFWNLPLEQLANFLEQPELTADGTVGTLDPKRRVKLLIQTLTKIGEVGFEAMENPPTVDNVARDVAAVLIGDLIAPPAAIEDVRSHAEQQLDSYKKAKHNIRSKREIPRLCPVCNQRFEVPKTALGDFLDKPTGFTGRKPAYDREGLTVCLACYYERLLRQIILGRKAYDLIVMLPRMSLGRYGGNVLVKKLKELQQYALDIAGADTTDPNESLRLDMTWFVARQALASDFSRMSARDLIRLFTYRTKEEKVRKNLKKVVKEVQDFLGSKDVEEACDFWERDWADWTEVAQAIAYNKINDQHARTIRESVYGLRSPIEFVAQTPNLVLAPSSRPRVSDSSALVDSSSDSDAKAALKQLLITLIFSLGLECSVAILSDRENLDALIMDASGTAYVPPLASIRDLVAKSRPRTEQQQLSPAWLSQQEATRWLQALASAVLLANQADYPPRNDLYQILTVRSKGALLRRIEQKGDKMYSENWQHLEAIGEVLP
jgi:hypothetical protein